VGTVWGKLVPDAIHCLQSILVFLVAQPRYQNRPEVERVHSIVTGKLALLVKAKGATMTGSDSLALKGGARPEVSIGLRVLSSLLLGLALAGSAFAQQLTETRITTLLPSTSICEEHDPKTGWKRLDPGTLSVADQFGSNPQKACVLYFNTEAIPDTAQIKTAALRLVQMGQQPNPSTLVITVASLGMDEDWKKNLKKFEDQNVGIIRSQRNENAVDVVDVWRSESGKLPPVIQWVGRQLKITLLLYPRESGSGRNYYPATGDTTINASKQPRLILTYTVPRSSVLRSPDSQTDGRVAMRSPRRFIPPSPKDAQQKNYTAMKVIDENTSSYEAALYDGLTYVVRQYDQEAHLDAQEPLGRFVWSKQLPSTEKEKARLVVNDSGRLTIVIRNHFLFYQLKPDPRPSGGWVDLRGVKAPSKLLAAPDGTLYVIDDTDIYALNPDLKMLWRTGIGTSNDARMALSPDGQFVYAVGLLPDGDNKKPALLAINAQTGSSTELSKEFAFPKETKYFKNPVVVRHPGGSDYIYVAANSRDSGVLKTTKNSPEGEIGESTAKLERIKDEKGLFSQPAPDSIAPPAEGDLAAKKLYVVWKNDQQTILRLVSVNAQSGVIENPDTTAIRDTSGENASVKDGSWLWNGGNLVMDSVANLVFSENGRLFAFGPDKKQLFATELGSLPEEPKLLFGSDGTLYANKNESGALEAILPQYDLSTAGVSDISSPTHLRVDGTVDKNTTLSAGGSVIVGSGFSVAQGATLKISTGVPQN
jgi:hypothetical protein